jgi:hypothetical protein
MGLSIGLGRGVGANDLIQTTMYSKQGLERAQSVAIAHVQTNFRL